METTSYSDINDKFIHKIKKFKSFFCYNNLSDEEIIELIEERTSELLEDAIDEFQPMISKMQKVNFYNKDDDNKEFLFKVTNEEIDLLSDLMVIKMMEEKELTLIEDNEYLGTDITVFSPNEQRKTSLLMTEQRRERFKKKVKRYNSSNRNTGDRLMPY